MGNNEGGSWRRRNSATAITLMTDFSFSHRQNMGNNIGQHFWQAVQSFRVSVASLGRTAVPSDNAEGIA